MSSVDGAAAFRGHGEGGMKLAPNIFGALRWEGTGKAAAA